MNEYKIRMSKKNKAMFHIDNNDYFLNLFERCVLRIKDNDNQSGIVKGKSGLILVLLHYYSVHKEDKYLDIIQSYIDRLIEHWDNNFTFGYGITGLAWILNIMKKLGLEYENSDEWIVELETILIIEGRCMINKNNFDYFNGASGLLFYFLSKDEMTPETKKLICDFILGLEKNKEKESSFYYKFKENNLEQLVLNLGVPHGITGIILMLLLIKEKNIINLEFDSLIHYFVNKLFENENINNSEYYFAPTISSDSNNFSKSVLAWCYGDLTTGYAIFKTGLLLNEEKYINVGLKILKDTTRRTDNHDEKLSLCHGYPSISCVYDEIYRKTNDLVFYEAAKKWKILIYDELSNAFAKNNYKNEDIYSVCENTSLFQGLPGLLLSVLTYGDETINEWKKCLLL
jgi:lantibiotic biosynthesis protein